MLLPPCSLLTPTLVLRLDGTICCACEGMGCRVANMGDDYGGHVNRVGFFAKEGE